MPLRRTPADADAERPLPWHDLPPLPAEFFARPTLEVARELVGALLVHHLPDGGEVAGRVVETEAYRGDDPACHAFGGAAARRRSRASGLFAAPGTAYVYLNYGVHWLLNVVTEPAGVAGAVLIRAVEPVGNWEAFRQRRPAARRRIDWANGPGKLTAAMGIGPQHHGGDLSAKPLHFAASPLPPPALAATGRIGISRGQELPWRFVEVGSPFVSPAKPGR